MKKRAKYTPEEMQRYESRLLKIMYRHVGRSKSISMGRLYEEVFLSAWENKINDTRLLRRMITALRAEGVAICSSSAINGGGYYVASAGSELAEYLDSLHRKALKLLAKEAKLKRQSLPELVGQMRLELTAAR